MTNLKNKIIIASISVLLNGIINAAIYTVSNVNNTGSGSFRQAITDANGVAGSTITFSIPITSANVKGYNFAYFRISPTTALPDITANRTYIDGSTERYYLGIDTNPYGPEIEINGASASGVAYGIGVGANTCGIREITICNFADGDGIDMLASSSHTYVKGCYIGITSTGSVASGNGYDGIWLTNFDTVNNITIGGISQEDRNVISGNAQNGINEFYSGALALTWICDVVGNYIGTDYTGTRAIRNGNSNNEGGVRFDSNNIYGHTVRNNVISGNYDYGVIMTDVHSNDTIKNNIIGVGADGITPIRNGNTTFGNVAFTNGVVGSTVTGNIIAYANTYGIHLDNAGAPDPIRIFISSNSIYNCTTLGIYREAGTNDNISPPLIRGATTYGSTGYVEGTSSPTAYVEVFIASVTNASAGQGIVYLGSTTASAGVWNLSVPTEYVGYMVANSSVTATQFVPRAGTSQFANNVRIRQGAVPVIYEKIKVTPRIMIY